MEDASSSLVENLLASSAVLTKRITFHKAKVPDIHTEILKSKYIPINSSSYKSDPKNQKNNKQIAQKEPHEEDQKPKLELFPEEKLRKLMRWSSVRKIGAGLNNLGNTCFLNSVLQCLTYTPPLANFALEKGHSRSCRAVGFCLFCELEQQITKSITSPGTAISPRSIVANLKRIAKHLKPGRQEDSHEFIRYVIDGIQKSCLEGFDKKIDPKIAETTVVSKIFGGHLQSQVLCSQCHYKSNTIDPFMDLCLEIKGTSVESSLATFTKPEILDKDNKYKCPKCKKLVQARKQFTVRNAPNVLTVQLKRFNFMGGKINKPVSYKERLDMAPYLSKESSSQASTAQYNLYAVLVHFGSSTRSGHYFCYVKSSNGTWYCMDDSSIRQVSLQTVLQQHAYMLFYVKDGVSSASLSNDIVEATASLTKSPASALSNPAKRKAEENQDESSKKQKVQGAESSPLANGNTSKPNTNKPNGKLHAVVSVPSTPVTSKPNGTKQPVNSAPTTPVQPLSKPSVASSPASANGTPIMSNEKPVAVSQAANKAQANGTPVAKRTQSAEILTTKTQNNPDSILNDNSKKRKLAQSAESYTQAKVEIVSNSKTNAANKKDLLEALNNINGEVASWGGVPVKRSKKDSSIYTNTAPIVPSELLASRYDEWDLEYDKGKERKEKTEKRFLSTTERNPFQAFQSKKRRQAMSHKTKMEAVALGKQPAPKRNPRFIRRRV